MNIFISSVITNFEAERKAVQEAIEMLGHQPVRAEDFPASANTPRVACLSGVRSSDLVVLIAGARYGAIQRDDLSATHEEFLEARERKSIIVFVQDGVERDERQAAFVRELEDWAEGSFTSHFTSPAQLHRLAVRAISEHEKSLLRGLPDEAEALERARELLGRSDDEPSPSIGRPTLVMALAGAPYQQIVRPRKLESPELEEHILQGALFGSSALFDRRQGSDTRIYKGRLRIQQDDRAIELTPDAGLRLILPIASDTMIGAIIEEEVRAALSLQFCFARWVLSVVDKPHRISHVAPAARIDHASYSGWRTREENTRNPGTINISVFGGDVGSVHLKPALVSRNALRTQQNELVDDLLVLLRREFSNE